MSRIEKLATLLKEMTYDELMEFAESISEWSRPDDGLNPVISCDAAAGLLSDRADGNLPDTTP